MNEDEVKSKLEEFASARFALDAIRLRMEALIDEVVTPEQRRQIAEIREEFEEQIACADAEAALREAELKELVRALGRSVRSDRAVVIYSKGRTSWDSDALSDIAQADEYKWLAKFRREGTPVVSIRMQ